MGDWVGEWQGWVFQPGHRYQLSYDQTDSSLVPFTPGDQSEIAERVGAHELLAVESVERGPFSDQVEVTFVTLDGLPMATPRELFPTSMQVPSEVWGSSTYELEKIRHVGPVSDRGQSAAETNEEKVVQTASTGGGGLADLFDQVGGLATLATVGLVALVVIKSLESVE